MAAARFSFGDVVLVPFPFTDQTGAKKRPAVVVSSSAYSSARRDIVIMAITSQVRKPLPFGETMVTDWQSAGLVKASVIKPVLRHHRAKPRDPRHGKAGSGRRQAPAQTNRTTARIVQQ